MSKYQFPISKNLPFEYSGPVYFRPIGRGICFPDDGALAHIGLEEMLEGNYYMTVKIERLPEDQKHSIHHGHKANE